MAIKNSTTVVQFETDTVEQFTVDTSKQEFIALTRIATNYQRMEQALIECWVGEGNSLCTETHNIVGDILAELDTELL
jgi:hypothetical protein